jgi:hypothetical protein
MVAILLSLLLGASTTLAPSLTPASSDFTSTISVTAKPLTAGSLIRCTTNGADPTIASTRYVAPLTVSATTTVKCRAWAKNKKMSPVVSSTYTYTGGSYVSCAAAPLRTGSQCGPSGTAACAVHYYCACGTGADAGCTAGNDANDGLTPATAKTSFASATATFRTMTGGDTVALCRGGVWTGSTTNIGNMNCGKTSAGASITATLDANFQTIPSGTVAPGTVCTMRDYTATWGGVTKPRIVNTSGDLFTLMNSGDDGGYEFTNLDTSGGGSAWFAYGWVHDVKFCANNIHNQSSGIQINGTASQSGSGLNWNISILENQFTEISGQGLYLEPGDNLDLSYNTFTRVASTGGAVHQYYVTSQHAAPWGEGTWGAHYLPNYNGRIRGNYHTGSFGGATCTSTPGKIAGKQYGLIVEDNTFYYPVAESTASCWLWGMSPSNDNDSAGFRNVIVRRNRFYGGGNQMTGITNCIDCTFENNLLWTDWVGDVTFLNANYAPNGTGHTPSTCVPGVVYGHTACDDHNTRLTIQNNTFFRASTSTYNKFLQIFTDGVGHIISNNAFWGGGAATGTGCVHNTTGVTPAFQGNNSCRAGSGTTAAATFVNAPTDFTPAIGSPLDAAGSNTYKASTDINLKARPNPPAIGAVER